MHSLCRRHHLLKDHADWYVSIDTKTLILNWTSPTGHTYPRKPRQSTPPDAWIGTAGTTIAEQLDRIAQLRTRPAPTAAATLTRYLADLEPGTETDEADTRPEPVTGLDPDTRRKAATHEDPEAPTSTTSTTSTTSEPAGTDPTTNAEPAPAEPAATTTGSAGDINRPTDTDTDTAASADQGRPNPPSLFEDHLTNALLRHAFNHPAKIEYEPGPLPEDDPPPF